MTKGDNEKIAHPGVKELRKAVKLAGTQMKLAQKLNEVLPSWITKIDQRHIASWLTRQKPSRNYTYFLEIAFKGEIKAKKIRPDIDWSSLEDGKHVKRKNKKKAGRI